MSRLIDAAVARWADGHTIDGLEEMACLGMLLARARDEDGSGMDDRQVRDEAMTLFVAGHETTANALT